MEELVNTSIENADSSLSYLQFTKNDKDAVEGLLNAVYDFKDFDVADADLLDVLFTYGDDYSAEKTTYTETKTKLKNKNTQAIQKKGFENEKNHQKTYN